MAIHANPAMKLVPVTVMVLLTYAEVGAMDVAAGAPSTATKLASDVTTLFGLPAPAVAIVKTTTLPPAVVPDPMTSLTLVAPRREHAAAVPPTVALHEAAASCAVVMKLAPVTVMLLLT